MEDRQYRHLVVRYYREVGGISVQEITTGVLDEKDMEFVEGLRRLGVNRNVASLITYLKNVAECSSRDIEMSTGLRQPEVSMAIDTMRKLGWISESETKGGRGRPQRRYALCVPIGEIIAHYEAERTKESAKTVEAFQRLKKLSSE